MVCEAAGGQGRGGQGRADAAGEELQVGGVLQRLWSIQGKTNKASVEPSLKLGRGACGAKHTSSRSNASFLRWCASRLVYVHAWSTGTGYQRTPASVTQCSTPLLTATFAAFAVALKASLYAPGQPTTDTPCHVAVPPEARLLPSAPRLSSTAMAALAASGWEEAVLPGTPCTATVTRTSSESAHQKQVDRR